MRRNISSGSPWEGKLGYSRAVIANGLVFISATAATGPDGKIVARGDVYAQTRAILDKLGQVLREAGATYQDAVQTRIYLTDIARWEDAGRAHGEVFGGVRPALTMLHVKPFLDPDMLVEIELTAIATATS
jgi:enamine deaminase RidA (YjgF/YER057c/UK114 family)